jgi:SulP family sulfate permease
VSTYEGMSFVLLHFFSTLVFSGCMAGTLLLHIGVDLFLEGVFDSYKSYDHLEYGGIVIITGVMTTLGMTAALLAGVLSALSTYCVQSITTLKPIFKISTAKTCKSSAWARSPASLSILNAERTGRGRVMMVQLQGHLFFGNITFVDKIKAALTEKQDAEDDPFIVILDFTLVVGMDSAAAHAIAKLKDALHKQFEVEVVTFVTGSHRDAFPCHYALREALHKDSKPVSRAEMEATVLTSRTRSECESVSIVPATLSVAPGTKSMQAAVAIQQFQKNLVCDSMNDALIFVENVLIARENPSLLAGDQISLDVLEDDDEVLGEEEERKRALQYLENLASASSDDTLNAKRAAAVILSRCKRETFFQNQILWRAGSPSDNLKLLVSGKLVAYVEGSDIHEMVTRGATIGELGLVQRIDRLSTVECVSLHAVTYTLDREAWNSLCRETPTVARVVDQIVIKFLSNRVQHVSNRIFETRCMPI